MRFEWDPEKAARNRSRHGVAFEEASTVFGDAFALEWNDTDHSAGEERFIIIGMSERLRMLTVVYVERIENTFRLISARQATARERRDYEETNRG